VIRVTENSDGTYSEDNPVRDVLWVRDRRISRLGYVLTCANCVRGISDDEFYTCLDLGQVAHVWCVKVGGGQ
jgi:hypothetical protein